MISFDAKKNFAYFVVVPRPTSTYATLANSHIRIFPNNTISNNTTRKKRTINGFAKRVSKQLKMTFNDTLPDCSESSLPCYGFLKKKVLKNFARDMVYFKNPIFPVRLIPSYQLLSLQ